MLVVNERISIPRDELRFRYARSGGPGGQNVNKVSSKAILSWSPASSPSIPADVLRRLLAQQRTRINKEGELLISSERYRDRQRNIDDCIEKLREMLVRAAVVPKRRRATKPTRGSKERRLRDKRQQSEKKTGRRGID